MKLEKVIRELQRRNVRFGNTPNEVLKEIIKILDEYRNRHMQMGRKYEQKLWALERLLPQGEGKRRVDDAMSDIVAAIGRLGYDLDQGAYSLKKHIKNQK